MKTKLTDFGQIDSGDRVTCKYAGRIRSYKVREVLSKGTSREEIIINKKQNKYFIVSMALDGSSWAKDVHVEKAA